MPKPRILACALASLILLALAFLPFERLGRASASKSISPVIDFSFAGYEGCMPLPSMPALLTVRPSGRDDTALLQAALDHVSSLPERNGFRGVLQLSKGQFHVAGTLRMRANGVVLRGSVNSGETTTIIATGTRRRTLIEIGQDSAPVLGVPVRVNDEAVPAGSSTLTLEGIASFSKGDRVVVTRPSTLEWIAAIGMNTAPGTFADQRLHWLPGSRDLIWDRTITEIDPAKKQITLDAPITTAVERRFGGATVAKVEANEPARHMGIEQLILESEFDASNPRDEEHSWIAIAMDHVEDAWVRDIVARHFAGSAVRVGQRARRITIEDCRSEQPISEIAGYRRQSFLVEGQQVLVHHCTSSGGMNDFASGFCAGGPNVFLDCQAIGALGPSGSFESWASGVLYERVRVEGAGLRLTSDVTRSQGGGWTAANSVIWNCEAKDLEGRGPEGAPNVVVTSEQSLYQSQLAKRLGEQAASPRPVQDEKTAKPVEFRWQEVNVSHKASSVSHPLRIIGGRFVIDDKIVWGGTIYTAWWKGQASPAIALRSGVSLTRFVPGRDGPGLTEDLPKLAARMVTEGMPFFQGWPGLWYDRRRDEHSIVERLDGNVWAPFYEMPWARSGQGTAWDGLSRYDLARFNPWYFERTREFARLSEQNGLVYYHTLYNTHNLLETKAHWVDFPWRPGNNINATGLMEPATDPGNTIHVANQFFDVSDARRRALHRAYILHNLDELGGSANVIFGLGFQYVGPLAFQQFFQDTVAEWEKAKGRRVRIALTTSKDITDAILADPVRAQQIAVIDMRYWQYKPDGSLWAPRSGQNLAFREMITKDFGRSGDNPPPTNAEQIYRQVREYRDRFPEKAIVAWFSGVGPIPVLMAGGSQALMRNPAAGQSLPPGPDRTTLDSFVREHLATVLMKMNPRDDLLDDAVHNWCLADARSAEIMIYSLAGPTINLAQALPHRHFNGVWFDPQTGKVAALNAPASWQKGTIIKKPSDGDWLLLLKRDPPGLK